MFLWFGFVQGECRGRHTFWAHRGGGLRIPEPGRHTIEPFRGKFTKKFSIVMYKYQQICTKSIIFTPTEYKTTDSGGHGTYFLEGNFRQNRPTPQGTSGRTQGGHAKCGGIRGGRRAEQREKQEKVPRKNRKVQQKTEKVPRNLSFPRHFSGPSRARFK